MTPREAAVLAIVRRRPGWTPAAIARHLNLDGPCDWCPVGPPRPGQRCATVPRASRERVGRVLRRLAAAGLVERGPMFGGWFEPGHPVIAEARAARSTAP